MKNNENAKKIAVSATVSTLIFALSLCFLLGGSRISANAENDMESSAISTNAEISEPQYSSGELTFDDSIWGRLAKAIADGINAWQD